MTSSARARIDGGTVRPSAFAVLRLTTSSKMAPLDDAAIPRIEALGRKALSPLLNSNRGGTIPIPTQDPFAQREAALS
jgi:hypothetical protein